MLQGFDSLVLSISGPDDSEAVSGLNPLLYHAAVEDALDQINAKAGSVLTHISMMIAAATFVVSTDDTHLLERIIIAVEISAYLFFALCCLRCLAYTDLPFGYGKQNRGAERYREELRGVVRVRGQILNFAVRWTFLVTFIFALSLAAHMFL